MAHEQKIDLICSYAAAGLAAAVAINSGALIAIMSQLGDPDFIPRLAVA